NSRRVGFPFCRHWCNNHRGNIKVVSLANSLFSAIAASTSLTLFFQFLEGTNRLLKNGFS
ncbi:hypothetical protein, partial [Limnospira sp.]|uniref:hypothetical protein n=1 Tax=Limnospira sp. TaxID=3100384 RepID=UPI003F6EBE9C